MNILFIETRYVAGLALLIFKIPHTHRTFAHCMHACPHPDSPALTWTSYPESDLMIPENQAL